MKISELAFKYNIDSALIKIWENSESEELLPVQKESIVNYGLFDGKSLIISAPTSSGKTFIGEMASIKSIYNMKKSIFLVPMKAIAEEKFADFREKYQHFGIKVVISTRDHKEYDKDIVTGNYHLAVIVYEKLERLLVSAPYILERCGTLVIDEVQMLKDPKRGEIMEMIIAKAIKENRTEKRENIQIIVLSAVLGNVEPLKKWLNCNALIFEKRPVELKEGIYTPDGNFHYLEYNSREEGIEKFPPYPAIYSLNESELEYETTPTNEIESEKLLLPVLQNLIAHFISENSQILIFRKFKRLSRESALYLSKNLDLPPVGDAIKELNNLDSTLSKDYLSESLRGGVAFHNADLTVEERLLVEKYFKNGEIRVLCATSTLARGVNLPADIVIIPDMQMIDPDAQGFNLIPISVAEYKNQSGRAGRYKYHRPGKSILLAKDEFTHNLLWQNYIKGEPENIDSVLHNSSLTDSYLNLVATNIANSDDDIYEFFIENTLSGKLYWEKQKIENRKQETELWGKLQKAKQKLLNSGLIKSLTVNRQSSIEITGLGRICALTGINIESFNILKEWLTIINPKNYDNWEILFALSHCKEAGEIYFRLSKSAYQDERYIEDLRGRRLSNRIDEFIEKSKDILGDRYEVVKRIKMSLLMYDWIEGKEYKTLEKEYNQEYDDKVYSGVIRDLAEIQSWMCDSLIQIAKYKNYSDNFISQISTLTKRLALGVKEEGLALAELNIIGLTRGFINRLVNSNFSSLEKIAKADIKEFDGIIPRSLAKKIQETIIENISPEDILIKYKNEQKHRLEKLGVDTFILENLYYTEGKLFEIAIENLLTSFPLELNFERLADQKEGEPDHLLYTSKGIIPFQVASNKSPISYKKAGEIINSGARYKPIALVVIGKPDFHSLAIENANKIAESYKISYKLIPVYILAEMYVRVWEKKLTKNDVIEILEKKNGYINNL